MVILLNKIIRIKRTIKINRQIKAIINSSNSNNKFQQMPKRIITHNLVYLN